MSGNSFIRSDSLFSAQLRRVDGFSSILDFGECFWTASGGLAVDSLGGDGKPKKSLSNLRLFDLFNFIRAPIIVFH
jgi:hypothetical protein